MAQSAYLYCRVTADPGLMMRVLVHGEEKPVDELKAAVDLHLSPKTTAGQEAEKTLRQQRGWIMNGIQGIDGVKSASPINPETRDIDFDVCRTDTAAWEDIMPAIGNVFAHVLGKEADITMLDD